MKLKILADDNCSAGCTTVNPMNMLDNNYEKPRRLNKKRKKEEHRAERYTRSTRSYD